MMDIDSTCEVDELFLFVEFKSHYDMSDAQRRYYERLTKLKGALGKRTVTVFYVVGDANKRICEGLNICSGGDWSGWQTMDWQSLCAKTQAFKLYLREQWIADRDAKLAAKN